MRFKRKMDSRGQAYSVFKLLIAAVVAGAILLILLQTLQVLPGIGQKDPNSSAANVVKSQINQPGIQRLIENVTFQNGDSLNARTIASDSGGLSEDQVCVFLSESTPNIEAFDDFGGSGKVVLYDGFSAQSVRMFVMCDRLGDIPTSLDRYDVDQRYGIDAGIGDCDTGNARPTSTYCIVSIISDQ